MTRVGCVVAMMLMLLAGCSRPAEEYRTFSEDEDGGVAVEPADSGPQAAADATPSAPASAAPAKPAAVDAPAPAPADAAEPPTDVRLPRPPQVPLPQRIAALGVDAAKPAEAAADATAEPQEIKLLVPDKEFARVDPDRSLRVSYDDLDLLKVLNMEPVPPDCTEYFPEWLKSLDGMQVRIRGFMIPPPRETGLPGFTLARDNQICCFGRDPKVYDVIPVLLKEGTTTHYIPNRPFDVVGRLFIRPDVYRGELQNLYEIEDAEVITR